MEEEEEAGGEAKASSGLFPGGRTVRSVSCTPASPDDRSPCVPKHLILLLCCSLIYPVLLDI